MGREEKLGKRRKMRRFFNCTGYLLDMGWLCLWHLENFEVEKMEKYTLSFRYWIVVVLEPIMEHLYYTSIAQFQDSL